VIWQTRPKICRRFVCLWYANPKFPAALRPDRCGVFFEPLKGTQVMSANVDPERPDVWKSGIARELIDRFTLQGVPVVVIVGEERHVCLPPSGWTPAKVWRRVVEGARANGWVA
jgi:hypothetical protein